MFDVCRPTLLENGKEETANPQRLLSLFLVFDVCFSVRTGKLQRVFTIKVLQKGFEVYFAYVIR